MHSSMQHGIRQQPSQQPNSAIRKPETYAIRPGDVVVWVLISDWQLGQIMCVVWGPTGTTVVMIAGPVGWGTFGTNGLAGGTPPTACA